MALSGSTNTLADSHSALATKIEVDVERPLREFATTNREMTQISTIQGNLAAMAKDVEKAQQKTEKLRGKGDKAEAGKVASANADLDMAQTQWESQAPYVFENLQALDETRLNHLRDVLTQFQTHEVDQVERSRITAEQCLNVILNVEVADEIKTFALKAVQSKPTLGRNQRNSIATPSRALTSSASSVTPSALTPSMSQPDDEFDSPRSGFVQEDKQKKPPERSEETGYGHGTEAREQNAVHSSDNFRVTGAQATTLAFHFLLWQTWQIEREYAHFRVAARIEFTRQTKITITTW